MLKHIFIFAATLFVCLSASAQEGALVFDQPVWDFGTIKEDGGKVAHKFRFTNKSASAVLIDRVSVSCGCTAPEFSKAPYKPGQSGEITITFNPMNQGQSVQKEVFVITSAGERTKLTIKGAITPRPKTVEDDYPLEMLSGLRLSDIQLPMRYLGQGTVKSMVVGYVNTSSKTINLSTALEPQASFIKVAAPSTVCAGCKGAITVTADLRDGEHYGMKSYDLWFTINGKRSEVPVNISFIGVDDFGGTDNDKAPVAILSDQLRLLGEVKRGKKASHTFTISNTGESPLVVRSVECDKQTTTTLKTGTTVAPGGKASFTVEISTDGLNPGRVFRTVTIITNDPSRPMRQLRVVADIE